MLCLTTFILILRGHVVISFAITNSRWFHPLHHLIFKEFLENWLYQVIRLNDFAFGVEFLTDSFWSLICLIFPVKLLAKGIISLVSSKLRMWDSADMWLECPPLVNLLGLLILFDPFFFHMLSKSFVIWHQIY